MLYPLSYSRASSPVYQAAATRRPRIPTIRRWRRADGVGQVSGM